MVRRAFHRHDGSRLARAWVDASATRKAMMTRLKHMAIVSSAILIVILIVAVAVN
jgi:hypothetical protein